MLIFYVVGDSVCEYFENELNDCVAIIYLLWLVHKTQDLLTKAGQTPKHKTPSSSHQSRQAHTQINTRGKTKTNASDRAHKEYTRSRRNQNHTQSHSRQSRTLPTKARKTTTLRSYDLKCVKSLTQAHSRVSKRSHTIATRPLKLTLAQSLAWQSINARRRIGQSAQNRARSCANGYSRIENLS